VVLLEPRHLPLADAVRQAIAVEMNLSETAFLEAIPTDGQDTADGACDAAVPCADVHCTATVPQRKVTGVTSQPCACAIKVEHGSSRPKGAHDRNAAETL